MRRGLNNISEGGRREIDGAWRSCEGAKRMNNLSFTVSDGVATLAIQRTAVSNAIDITIIRAMHLALDQIQKGEGGARAVVITGSNDVFCSGLDLHSVDLKTQEARQRAHFEMRRFMDPLILRLSGFRFPIVAAVNGAAVGAGMSLALASDIIMAADNAYFLPSFARLGLCPMRESPFTWRAALARAAPCLR